MHRIKVLLRMRLLIHPYPNEPIADPAASAEITNPSPLGLFSPSKYVGRTIASVGRYTAARIKRAILRVLSNLSFQRVFTPTLNRRSIFSPASRAVCFDSWPMSPTRKKSIASAATINKPAETQKEFIEPTVEINAAPIAGPKIQAVPMNPS